jgi:hypothetical protein
MDKVTTLNHTERLNCLYLIQLENIGPIALFQLIRQLLQRRRRWRQSPN